MFSPKKGKYVRWLMNVLINWMGKPFTIYLFIKSYIMPLKSYNIYVDYSLIKLKKTRKLQKKKRKQLPQCLFSNVWCKLYPLFSLFKLYKLIQCMYTSNENKSIPETHNRDESNSNVFCGEVRHKIPCTIWFHKYEILAGRSNLK